MIMKNKKNKACVFLDDQISISKICDEYDMRKEERYNLVNSLILKITVMTDESTNI